MTLEQSLVAAPPADVGDPHEPNSAAWWQHRTAEELRDIINRGFSGGQVFQDAVAEAERRARDETKRLRAIAASEALRRRKRGRIIWAAAAFLLVMAVLLGFWLGR